jgi:large conductance mechanosensitive channel
MMKEENKNTRDKKFTSITSEVKGFWQEFKDFAFKGNMLDLAVGIIIGAAFKDLVTSLVNNIITPPIGKILGNSNFESLYINLDTVDYETLEAAEVAGAPIIKYGLFTMNLIDFLLMALTIFVVLKIIFRIKAKDEVKKKEEIKANKQNKSSKVASAS